MKYLSRAMKLRIRGNSLRLRLTRGEITELIATGTVENRVQLGADAGCGLVYQAKLSSTVAKPAVTFHSSTICVWLPAAEGLEWAGGNRVGLYGEENWGLKLIIEKDFKCLDPRLAEDDSDAYENPGGASHAACAAVSE